MANSATEHVIHGPSNYIDYDKVTGSKRQLLVTDKMATILSNFLAVFLSLAARSLYQIVRRILQVRNANHGNDDPPEDEPAQLAADDDELEMTEPAQPLAVDELEMTEPAQPAAVDDLEITDLAQPTAIDELDITESTTGTAKAHGADEMNAPQAAETPQHQNDRLDVINESHDTETLIVKTFSNLLSLLRGIVPIQPLGDNTPLYRRILSARFWQDAFEIANKNSDDLLWYIYINVGAVSMYFGALLLGIMSAYPVVGDSVAVSRHPNCGIAFPPLDVAQRGSALKYYNDVARESRQYARSCYGIGSSASDTPGPESCSFFYKPTITYSAIDNDTCPFRNDDGNLCFEGENSAYTITTGITRDRLVDASSIGINSPWQYKFHRSITCSPLVMDGYVQKFTRNDTLGQRYFYGNFTDSRCTLDLPDCTFEVLSYPDPHMSYNILTAATGLLRTSDWYPIFDVNKSRGETATLMLISNIGIFYPRPSLDPIFFANSSLSSNIFYNARFHASMLGCMSRTLVCLPGVGPDLEQCYNLTGLFHLKIDASNREHDPIRKMLYYSLFPDLYAQVNLLSREALDAQSLLLDSTSLALPKDQWKAEVRQMFESLLARTQITARNIARGDPAKQLPGHKLLQGPGLKAMCRSTLYKFRSVGWKNVNVVHFLAELMVGLLVCFVGIKRDDEELWIEKPVRSVVRSSFVRCCADWWNKMRELWREYSPTVWSWACLLVSLPWLALCSAAIMAWSGARAIWACL